MYDPKERGTLASILTRAQKIFRFSYAAVRKITTVWPLASARCVARAGCAIVVGSQGHSPMPVEADKREATAAYVSARIIAAGIIIAFLYWAASVIVTLLVAVLLAYFLDPVVSRLEDMGLARAASQDAAGLKPISPGAREDARLLEQLREHIWSAASNVPIRGPPTRISGSTSPMTAAWCSRATRRRCPGQCPSAVNTLLRMKIVSRTNIRPTSRVAPVESKSGPHYASLAV